MPLKLLGELSCCCPCLVHRGYAQMQVELIILEPVPDMFDDLPPGGIATICPSRPISLHNPQCTASLQLRINVWAHCQTSHSMDSCWSQIVGHGMGVGWYPVLDRHKPRFKRGISGPLLQIGHHLSQTFYHHSLDRHAQFPPTVWQPKGWAAGYRGGQAEICCKVWISIQMAWHLDALPQCRCRWCST